MVYGVKKVRSSTSSVANAVHESHRPAFSALAAGVRMAVLGLGVAHGAVNAATIQVNSNLDDGTNCTLRDALASVSGASLVAGCGNSGQAFGINDTITFAQSLAGRAVILQGQNLAITTPDMEVSIDATAIGGITIDANNQSRVLRVADANVEINNLTMVGGSIGFSGAAIIATDASLEITNSTLSGNTAVGNGGAIIAFNSSVTINNSTLSDNTALRIGGAILADNSSITVNNSVLSSNSATISSGGIHAGRESSITLNNSTVSGNVTDTYGGGIHISVTSSATISNSTISDNRGIPGGGLYARKFSTVTLSNSIIANSVVGNDCDLRSISPTDGSLDETVVTVDNASIVTSGGCGAVRTADPILLPLLDNGCVVTHSTPNGQACVKSHALGSGSPAIDTAMNSVAMVDQVGTSRPQNSAADVGAIEVPSITSPPPPNSPGFTVTALDAVEGQAPNVVLFTITLDSPLPVATGYDFNTVAGTAIDGEDYVGRVGRAIFPAGVTVRERRVTVLNDGVANEPDETFSMVVTDINDPLATVSAEAVIRENSNTPVLPVLSVAQVRTSERTGRAGVVISLSEPSNERITVNYQTATSVGVTNPAMAGVDYTPRTGTIVFQPGKIRAVRTIILVNDNVTEADEVFRFELSDASNAQIDSDPAGQQVVIVNDDYANL